MSKKVKFEVGFVVWFVWLLILLFVIGLSSPYYNDCWWGYYYYSKIDAMDVGITTWDAVIYKSRDGNVIERKILEWDIKGVNHDDSFIVAYVVEGSTDQCYIVDKWSEKIYGPFSEEEYREKAQSLGLSKKLKCVK